MLAYEDQYEKNGDIAHRNSVEYANGIYVLNSKMNGTTSSLVMFMVTEDVHYIEMLNVDRYEFEGKMNREDDPTYKFEVNIGMPANHYICGNNVSN